MELSAHLDHTTIKTCKNMFRLYFCRFFCNARPNNNPSRHKPKYAFTDFMKIFGFLKYIVQKIV